MNIIEKIFHDPDFDQLNNMVRWNGHNRIKDETVAHHSYFVALVSRLMSEEIFKNSTAHSFNDLKLRIVTYAMLHDFDEIFTGDISHNVKYGTSSGTTLRDLLDKIVVEKSELKFNKDKKSEILLFENIAEPIDSIIKKLVKVADWLSMLFYLKKEFSLGNKSMLKEIDYCIERLRFSCVDLSKILEGSDIPQECIDYGIIKQIYNKESWI